MNALTTASANSVTHTAQPKVALIAEGGGQRGIFTAGVLDAWLEQNYDPFDLFIGTGKPGVSGPICSLNSPLKIPVFFRDT